jgi:hypothetical protein
VARERGFYMDAVVKGYFDATDLGDIEGANTMVHQATNFVVDTGKETCAVKIVYRNDRKDRMLVDMENCKFFDFGLGGRFTRVHLWTGSVAD